MALSPLDRSLQANEGDVQSKQWNFLLLSPQSPVPSSQFPVPSGANFVEAPTYQDMLQKGFEELVVYQRAGVLSDEIRAAVLDWPSRDAWSLGIQLMRAADSVGANIAEATGRWTLREQARFLHIARGSVNEVEHCLIRAAARDLPLPDAARPRAKEIARMLNGLLRSARTPRT